MEYAINQPLEKYNVTLPDGKILGLYETYKERPALLGAVMLMTTAPTAYEEGSLVPFGERPARIEPTIEGYLSDTLISCVGGKMVITLMEFMNPQEFFEYLIGFDLSGLPIRKFYHSDTNMRLIIKSRVGAWNWMFGAGIRKDLYGYHKAYQQVMAVTNQPYLQ